MGDPGKVEPPARRRLEQATRGMPETEGRTAETVGHGNFEQIPVRGGLASVAVRRQTIRHDRGTDEAGAIVDRLATEAIPSRAKRRWPELERLFERCREMLELR